MLCLHSWYAKNAYANSMLILRTGQLVACVKMSHPYVGRGVDMVEGEGQKIHSHTHTHIHLKKF